MHSERYPRSRTFSRTRLATLHMMVGDPREAVTVGRQAVLDAAHLNSRRLDGELAQLIRACEGHRSIPDVAELSGFAASVVTDI